MHSDKEHLIERIEKNVAANESFDKAYYAAYALIQDHGGADITPFLSKTVDALSAKNDARSALILSYFMIALSKPEDTLIKSEGLKKAFDLVKDQVANHTDKTIYDAVVAAKAVSLKSTDPVIKKEAAANWSTLFNVLIETDRQKAASVYRDVINTTTSWPWNPGKLINKAAKEAAQRRPDITQRYGR